MGFLSVIRRWALRDKMPIREIARRTGLSRNTIKKYLREDAVEPRFKTPSRPRFQTHNQNMKVAARAIADRKTLGHLS